MGLLTGLITLRLRGLYLGLTTWFVAEALRFTISNTPELHPRHARPRGRSVPDRSGIDFARGQLLNYYYLLIVLGALIMLAMHFLVRSRIGLAFRAIREDQLATESLGLNATRYKLINFTVACFLTGVLGSFYAHYLGILSPTPEEFGVPRTVEILTVCYVGGRGTLWGSLFAGFLLIGFQEYFRELEAWRLVMYGALLIVGHAVRAQGPRRAQEIRVVRARSRPFRPPHASTRGRLRWSGAADDPADAPDRSRSLGETDRAP